MQAKRQKTPAAKVAALCKKFVKSLGLDCSASSDNFSGGDSVRVKTLNANQKQRAEIDKYCDQFQRGHFDGMTDLYEYSNRRDDIPQTKYMFCEYSYSDDIQQAAYEWVRDNFADSEELAQLPPDYKNPANNHLRIYGEFVSTQVFRALGSSLLLGQKGFWDSYEQKTQKTAAPVDAVQSEKAPLEVVKVFHEKMGQDIFIVTFPQLERDEFDRVLDQAKKAGGWYSRRWGTSPAGFAFKTENAAHDFVNEKTPLERHECGSKLHDPDGAMNTRPNCDGFKYSHKPQTNKSAAKSEKLLDIAEKAEKEAGEKLGDKLTNTQKRLAQAMSARIDGQRLQRVAQAARALAQMWIDGTIPQGLQHYAAKATLYKDLRGKTQQVPNGFHAYPIETGEPSDCANLELWALATDKQEPQNLEILKLKNKLQFASIPGYFPTPSGVCEIIAEKLAHIKNRSFSMLEPSAGSGNLCKFAKKLWPDVQITAFEINSDLAKLLNFEGFDVINSDFMAADQLPFFDLVLMNPPFEKLQDVAHVMHAYKSLRDGGELVAIMSPSFTYIQDKRAVAFRDFIDSIGAHVEKLPDGSFKESGTGVAAFLVHIRKGF